MIRASISALGAALCAVGFVGTPAIAQVAPKSSQTSVTTAPLRNVFGQPDLSGNWSSATLTPLTRDARLADKAALTADEARAFEKTFTDGLEARDARSDPNSLPGSEEDKAKDAKLIGARADFAGAGGAVGGYNTFWLDPGTRLLEINGEYRTSILTTANGQPPARKPNGQKSAGGGPPRDSYDSYETRSLGERCIVSFGRNAGPPMLPNGYYNNNYQIIQTADAVAIDVEMIHDLRVIPLKAAHRKDGLRPWMGDAIGRYEGDTLIVETTNIPQAQSFMGSWDKLKVTEWFTRVSPTKMLYRFQVEDPDTWDTPWGGEYTFQPLNGKLYEYACHEGNYALHGILSGARELEAQEAASKAAKPKH